MRKFLFCMNDVKLLTWLHFILTNTILMLLHILLLLHLPLHRSRVIFPHSEILSMGKIRFLLCPMIVSVILLCLTNGVCHPVSSKKSYFVWQYWVFCCWHGNQPLVIQSYQRNKSFRIWTLTPFPHPSPNLPHCVPLYHLREKKDYIQYLVFQIHLTQVLHQVLLLVLFKVIQKLPNQVFQVLHQVLLNILHQVPAHVPLQNLPQVPTQVLFKLLP